MQIDRLLAALCLVGVAALMFLGVRALLAQGRIEQALEEFGGTTNQILTTIEGEISGMAPDFSTPVTCGEHTTTITTYCGQGQDPSGDPVDPNETWDQCAARHRRKIEAWEQGCER